MPLTQVASVTVADARSLVITPWEKPMVQAVEKAILASDLGLNPTTAGTVIRINLPALTEERRKELSKLVHNEGENTKIAIRSEEHTSELPSLMRISYAVFCLTKKKQYNTTKSPTPYST